MPSEESFCVILPSLRRGLNLVPMVPDVPEGPMTIRFPYRNARITASPIPLVRHPDSFVDQTYFDDIRQRIHGRNGLVGIAGVCVFERDRANGHLRDIRWWIEVTPYEGRQIEECLAGMRSTDLLVA